MPDPQPNFLTVSGYNLALQQARINQMPEAVRIRMGELMLKGWVFTLAGSNLNEHDQFEDWWTAKGPRLPGGAFQTMHYSGAPLGVQIHRATMYEAGHSGWATFLEHDR